jgi:RNA polymerase sigma-70 factor (ECF subfamily)
MARAFATLSERQREAIEMAYFSGMTQLGIAGRTGGAPLGTVNSRVRLGLLSLRSAMTSEAAAQR